MTLRNLIDRERPFGIPVNSGEDILPSFTALQENMNRLFDHLYRGSEVYLTNWDKTNAVPLVNIAEDDKAFRVEAELPGIPPEAIDVSVSEGILTIKGEKKTEKEEKKENYLRHESSFGSFYRQINLPASANCDKAEASFKHGILTVSVPKKAEAMEHTRKLQIKKAA